MSTGFHGEETEKTESAVKPTRKGEGVEIAFNGSFGMLRLRWTHERWLMPWPYGKGPELL